MNHLKTDEGYDEFLAQKIAKSRNDIKNGRYVTIEKLDKEITELLIQKERELQVLC